MDFAPRDNFSVIDAVKLHAIISCTGLIGSPKPIPASPKIEGSVYCRDCHRRCHPRASYALNTVRRAA